MVGKIPRVPEYAEILFWKYIFIFFSIQCHISLLFFKINSLLTPDINNRNVYNINLFCLLILLTYIFVLLVPLECLYIAFLHMIYVRNRRKHLSIYDSIWIPSHYSNLFSVCHFRHLLHNEIFLKNFVT